MKWHPHLSFNGRCEAAFQFYERCLGGRIVTMLTWGGSPLESQAPPEWAGKILHATLTVGGNVLSGADVPPPQYEAPKGFCVQLNTGDPAEAERVFGALAENGTVRIPLQKTFWSVGYGVLVDQFGIPWEINCEQA
jgi:PhnB protein